MVLFWDASAVVPLTVSESSTPGLRALLRRTDRMAVWWGTRVECVSAIARRSRGGTLTPAAEMAARQALGVLAAEWIEVGPNRSVRAVAERLLGVHDLRAADALQLAAAFDWSAGEPTGRAFVSLDRRLREAATREGFTVQPVAV